MADLQAFVSRFSANASKAKQATSRAKQLDKIEKVKILEGAMQNSPDFATDVKVTVDGITGNNTNINLA